MIALGVAAYYLVQSYRVPMLNDIAKPTEWIDYWQELLVKYRNGQGIFTSADEEFTDHLIRLYADVAGDNINANDKRGIRLVKSNNALLVAFALLVTTALTFYYNNYLLQDDTKAKGGDLMFATENALLCVPATQILNIGGGPGKRPVPDPAPPPSSSAKK